MPFLWSLCDRLLRPLEDVRITVLTALRGLHTLEDYYQRALKGPYGLQTHADRLNDPEMTYVALTRPSLLLKVFGSAATIARLKAGPMQP